jgi:chromate reductase
MFGASVTSTDPAVWRLLAISGSLRAGSSNTQLLRTASAVAPKDMSVVIYSALALLPHFNPDLEQGPEISAVADFRLQLRKSHAVLISSPEYAHGVPGVLKNALDWIVGTGELYGKPVAILNASPRGTHAQAALTETLSVMGAKLVSKASITMDFSAMQADEGNVLSNPALTAKIREALTALTRSIGASCSK